MTRTFRIIEGDALKVAQGLPGESVQCVVTSPPYFSLRDYGVPGQIGLEGTPEAYVFALVEVFREVRRVLKTNGIVWLNLGDSYSGDRGNTANAPGYDNKAAKGGANLNFGSKKSVGSNPANSLKCVMESGTLVFGDAATVGITGKRRDVSLHDDGFPQRVLLSLLGIERVTVKQRDNNFSQVLHTLASPSYCWVDVPVAFAAVNGSDLEIVVDACDDLSIVIAEHDVDAQSVFSVSRVASRRPRPDEDGALTVEQAAKPITEVIRDGESVGNPVAFDSPLESLPDIYFVNEPVALGDRLDARPCHRPDFRVAKATEQEVAFAFGNFGLQIRTAFVSHLFSPNRFGSLVRYAELYDKAIRRANAMQPKQELGIPEMLKRALMEDGWICRQTIIWHKPNPMPESVTDRCTKAHESIFLLSKSPRYYFNAEAIAEPAQDWGTRDRTNGKYHNEGTGLQPHGDLSGVRPQKRRALELAAEKGLTPEHLAAIRAAGMTDAGKAQATQLGFGKNTEEVQRLAAEAKEALGGYHREFLSGETRNRRSVWSVSPKPSREDHYAAYPPDLIEPCILAGSKEGDTVYDPFGGSGTTALVALRLNRNAILSELNPDYVQMARRRILNDAPLLNTEAAA